MTETATTHLAGPMVQLRRNPRRGSYDPESIYAIIDEALVGHLAFIKDGVAMTLPLAHARVGDQLYLHGAVQNGMLRALCANGRASITFTLLDGLVFARTAFHHSMNYRCAVVVGQAREVTETQEKQAALAAIIDHMADGRMAELGNPTATELKATCVLAVTIDEASAKCRAGGPIDAPEDLALDVWAGTVPVHLQVGAPLPEAQLRSTVPLSPAVAHHVGSHAPVTRQIGERVYSTDPGRLDQALIHHFLRDESYWARGLDAARCQASLQQALCFGVYHNEQQLGFARVVTDGSRVAYLGDVFVVAEARGQGVGKQLLEFVLDHPALRSIDRILLATRDAHSFYAPFGFVEAHPDRYMLRLAPHVSDFAQARPPT